MASTTTEIVSRNQGASGAGVTANSLAAVAAASSQLQLQCKRMKRLHSYEINPSVRKRQQARLLRKLHALMEEYIARVGQQAVLVCCSSSKQRREPSRLYPQHQAQRHPYRVYGSQPLETVVRNHRRKITSSLEAVLSQQTPPTDDSSGPATSPLFDMPALSVDGVPASLTNMTQAQLRAFIPEMMKYSTGRSKPGWGKPDCRPVWWPQDVPWANVRSDVRDETTKTSVNWTVALRNIIISCYSYHGREDLLHHTNSSLCLDGLSPPHKRTNHHAEATSVNCQSIQSAALSLHPHNTAAEGAAAILNAIQSAATTTVGSDHASSLSDWSLVELEGGNITAEDSNHQSVQFVQLLDGTQARLVHTLPYSLVKYESAADEEMKDEECGGRKPDCRSGKGRSQTVTVSTDHGQQQQQETAPQPIFVASGDWGGGPLNITLPVSVYESLMAGLSQSGDSVSVLSQEGYQIVSVVESGGGVSDHVINSDVPIGGNRDSDAGDILGNDT